jgi:tellurite resistance protein
VFTVLPYENGSIRNAERDEGRQEERKKEKEEKLKEMKANQGKADIMLAKLDANQEKAAADRKADKEEMKAAMQSMRSELNETIQHRIENIFAIFEHDKRVLQSELNERIEKIKEKLQTAEVFLCAQTTKLQEDLEEAKREFRARLDETR